MSLSHRVSGALDQLCAKGRVEVQEDGSWIALLEGFQYEVREHGELVLLHLWSGECNLVRRVQGICGDAPECLALEVSRFGRARPGRLEFVTPPADRPAGKLLREQFRARFRQLLSQEFPDEKIASLVTGADLEHSISGNYTRGVLESVNAAWAIMGAAPGENPATYDGLLTFALLWLDRAQKSVRAGRSAKARDTVKGVRLFFPEGEGRFTAHRLQALSASTLVEIYEYSEATWRVRRLDAQDRGNVETWLVPLRDVHSVMHQANQAIERIRSFAPSAIEAEVVPGMAQVVFRFRGLTFARWQDGSIFYGIGDPREPLTPERETDFADLVRDLEVHRSPLAAVSKHPLYRAQPERWLQTMVAADPTRVDATLDPRFLYSQVPAFSAGDRGIMDLLGVTRNGRLAVIELKASEDIQLVSQGVDYWLRVRWHHAQQDFSRYGYFPGISLDPRPPLLILLGPSLQFHPSGDIILQFLSPEIEVCRVGVSENWRRGLKVVLRQARSSVSAG